MNNTVSIPAPAKINLFLDVTGRRADGYHTITGVMQTIGIFDLVTVSLTHAPGAGGITLTNTSPLLPHLGPALPTDRRNIGWKATEAYMAAAGMDPADWMITIGIEKNIPSPAGLAGGSADAAAVLKAMNKLTGYAVPRDVLYAAAARLGADVPFCLTGGACVTEGIGDVLTLVTPLPDCDVLVACAGEGVSTPAAYRTLDETYGGFADGAYAPKYAALDGQLSALAAGDLDGIGAHAFNLFESVVLPHHDEARSFKRLMLENGAVCAMMSGSGPAVFGLFRKGTAQPAVDAIIEAGHACRVCHPVSGEDCRV
ncbi:MAG: 4-(cytidine 5'-diphospho)-2-C-methyl-D-erythritol kinase [Clostridia bacterium]|nr:4-(cytidine 5'-diphospho)-2-C-methyl-D-erythritol kinase [Clostridia bacterium]